MARIDFEDALLTGDNVVDSHHRELFGMFNDIHEAAERGRDAEEIGPLLQRLQDYTIRHFMAEQELMARTRFPADDMLAHVEEHEQLVERVRALITDYRTGGLDSAIPLLGLLQEWLTGHIRQRDSRLVEHIRTCEEAGS